ncbi:MAG TPA: flagellar filament capping protein FliD [Nitrospiraceae bacterium]|nr:flagellar filament capping protein FliD [Nitrospiraceae bacterium]
MASISFGGLGNGVDFGQVITQLVAIERLPIDNLNKSKNTLQSKLTDYGSIADKLLALQAAGDSLRLPTAFDRSTATVSDQTVLSASAASTAPPGSYLMQVTQLAQSHQITNKAATAVSSVTTDIVGGASALFTFRVGTGTDQTVTLSDTATLEDLRTGINDLGAGVTASIVNAGSETTPAYRLILTATTSGASNGVTIVADGTALDFANAGGTGGIDTLQAAQDAIAILGDPARNPVTLQRSSNVITDAIPDVTLSLTKTTGTSAVSVNVTSDNGAVKDNIKKFVTAYNDIVTFVNKETAYDATTKTGALLYNESTVKGFVSQIRQALSAPIAGLTIYRSTGEIGFKTNRDGTITLEDAKLDGALSTNYNAVKSLFINQTTVAGVAQQVNRAIDAIDDVVSGSLTGRKNSLTKQINSLADQISRKETAISAFEERLKIQYAKLDSLLSQLQGQTNFLNTLGKQ